MSLRWHKAIWLGSGLAGGLGFTVVVMYLLSLLAPADRAEGPAGGGGPPPGAGGGPPPARAFLGSVLVEPVAIRRRVNGTVVPALYARVAAEESGRVKVAPPREGTFVEAGSTLAEVDTTLLDEQILRVESNVAAALNSIEERVALMEQARSELTRLERLAGSNMRAASEKELTDARFAFEAAQARLLNARADHAARAAQLGELTKRLEKCRVVAPFAGYVERRLTEVGEWLSPGSVVAELAGVGEVDVVLNVPEVQIRQLRSDEPVVLEFEALGADGESYRIETREHARLMQVGDAVSRTFALRIRVPNREGILRPGMSVSAQLRNGEVEPRTLVPLAAIQRTGEGSRVVAVRGGVAVPVPVNVLFTEGERAAVTAELRSGELVALGGKERMFPGQPVIPLTPLGNPDEVAGPERRPGVVSPSTPRGEERGAGQGSDSAIEAALPVPGRPS